MQRRGVRKATEAAVLTPPADARGEVGRGGDQLAPRALATPLGAVELRKGFMPHGCAVVVSGLIIKTVNSHSQ